MNIKRLKPEISGGKIPHQFVIIPTIGVKTYTYDYGYTTVTSFFLLWLLWGVSIHFDAREYDE